MLNFHPLFLPLCPYGTICHMMFSLLTLFVHLSHLFVLFSLFLGCIPIELYSILLLYVTLAYWHKLYGKK